ncbi:Flagellar-associated PapD-like, putative [Angomonas deanei]|uniref:Flagellar-associated PapD-like, putative n=1 Tax=Angomonas deanei TaxID=59799 RepID=A0A7G2CE31_9TRYP|nr:Flagellar-associated PapD-like, putative [Angomonas deanei]
MGQKFTFTPSTGTLQPGDSTVLKIELKSDLIGVLNETFRIHLHGSLDELTLQFKGRIVGPSFQFNVDELDFGNVSFNFWHQRPFNISNTGQVPMIYNLRLAPDGGREEEFTIKPSKGVIPPMESESIVLEYLSNTAGELETALLVDIEDVGEAVDSIPIKAACMVAPLTLTQNRLGYGNCFIDYEYCLNVEVVNDTALSGKFQLDVVDKKGIEKVAKVTIGEPDQQTPIVILDPHSKVQVPVSLRVLAVGDLTFSLALHVLGEEGPSQTVLINAVGCGPNVDVHPTALNFGAVEVLQSEEKTLTLHNTSPIPASFKVVLAKMQEKMASTKGEPKNAWDLDSIFRVEPEAAVIEPFGEMTLKVIATADEAMTFTENLVLDIQYAEESVEPIQLKANGKGFPLRAEEDITAINLGDVFTDTPVSREVVIHNKGRKEQEVQWQNSRGAKVKEGAPPIVFNYKPERCIIRPRESYTFVVEGYIKQVGTFSDEFTLKQSGTFKEILRSTVSANFLEPLLLCSTRHIPFEYVEQVVTDATPNTNSCPNTKLQSFTVKNTTPKDLEVVLKIMKNKSKTPFSFEGPSRFNLASGETQVVGVAFDPHYLGDYTSHTVKNQIQMSFTNHSRTETITLSAKIAFPSLLMEPAEEINFGTIVKDTEAHQELLLINPSPNIPAVFQWEMLDANGEPSTTNEAIRLFDFAPFHGVIPPGGTQKVQATFYGTAGKHASKGAVHLAGRTPLHH